MLRNSSWLAALYLASFATEACSSPPGCRSDGLGVSGAASDMGSSTKVEYYPASMPFNGRPIVKGAPAPTYHFNHDFVVEEEEEEGEGEAAQGLALEGVNELGLNFGLLWGPGEDGVVFNSRYNPAGPPAAIALADLGAYALGNFATVRQVRDFLNPSVLQLTTQGRMALRLHFADASGEGLLVEAAPAGSFLVRDAPGKLPATNKPAARWACYPGSGPETGMLYAPQPSWAGVSYGDAYRPLAQHAYYGSSYAGSESGSWGSELSWSPSSSPPPPPPPAPMYHTMRGVAVAQGQGREGRRGYTRGGSSQGRRGSTQRY